MTTEDTLVQLSKPATLTCSVTGMKSKPNVTWSTAAIADLDGDSVYNVVNNDVTAGYTMTSVLTVNKAMVDTNFTCTVESSDWGSDSPKLGSPELDVFGRFSFSRDGTDRIRKCWSLIG